jgi:hypothetical protein
MGMGVEGSDMVEVMWLGWVKVGIGEYFVLNVLDVR